MNDERAMVDRVRQVVVACGGWNRRSRGALLAWARAEGIDDAQLGVLLSKALAMPRPARPPHAPIEPPSAAPQAVAATSRWWLVALASAGLVASALLALRLAPRIDTARAVAKPTPVATVPVEPVRTLPPAPVSFPTPPEIRPAATPAPLVAPQPLGTRPAGELSRVSLQTWRDAFSAIAHAWPALPAAQRDAAIASLAEWVAGCGTADLAALRAARSQAMERMEAADRLLADALDAMVVAQVASDPGVSSAVAADAAFASAGRTDASRALVAWATAQVPALCRDLGSSDARARWAAWLQAVGSITNERERVSIAIAAIDALLHGDARLDGQGLAADALGSLLAGVPSRPAQAGFAPVREAWIAWLRDTRLPSARLWALGGIWRARGGAPDAWLLPGERDGVQARVALADRWSRLTAAQPEPEWQALLAELGRDTPRPADAALATRIEDLAARVRLVRRCESPAAALGALDTAPQPAVTVKREAPSESRWARQLGDANAEVRQRTMRELRAEAPESLATADAAALAARAIGAQAREERALAQEIIRGALVENAVMRNAVSREVALCADPRLVADFLERLIGEPMPLDDANALRARALGGLLRPSESDRQAQATLIATQRLADETCAWCGLSSRAPLRDPADAAWKLARQACAEAIASRPPTVVQPLASGLPDRSRRLERFASDGPRGFAAALALLCDARAVRLSVQHASRAEDLRRLADGASAARSRAGDALQQAAISLESLAAMQLLVQGAPVPVAASDTRAGQTIAEAARDAAWVELGRADALLAASPVDRKRLAGALRHAISLDSAVAGEAALALAQGCDDDLERSRHLEAARMLGAGAALPPIDSLDAADGIALAQVLAWSERGQTDRLMASKLPERVRFALAGFALACGSSTEDCLASLRQTGSDGCVRLGERLRAAALRALDPSSAGWLGAIAAGDSGSLPEGDAAQPWRFTIPGG